MKMIDNITTTVHDDLQQTIRKGRNEHLFQTVMRELLLLTKDEKRYEYG